MLTSDISLWGAACAIFRRKCLVGLWLLALPVAALVFVGCDKDNTHVSSPYDMNCPVGFGANVTGGGGQNVVTVTTQEALREVLAGTEPVTVYVKGTINLDSTISVGSNKSILGLSGAVISNRHRDTTAGVFLLMGSDNIIIRNLTILGPGAYDIDANFNDNISLIGATNVWVDHCDIQDGIDGNMDITNGSDNVCVSWTRFRYLIEPSAHGSGGNDDHRNSNLIGGSNNTADLDAGKLNCTFINCWWGGGMLRTLPARQVWQSACRQLPLRWRGLPLLHRLWSVLQSYACIDNMPSSIASHAERQSELIDRQENDYYSLMT